mmetsp:Transcript_7170/g.9071  ORF Transcript_7170/g.9071 Transcript_7170/m.9071 type:complete len:128 (-) Transcript_7170:508-891(-)|eukprot:CAMPEP_0204828926 /NCGR_PEP_ID=MMETSP1346-20131115/6894_1 /ASSEMBLY_ACC=CAM_ASM_000771 /TAXON_ID=215587 /ORGANISM="Aplanochytrium stocchinoi, Strain GSBS06" /LENGTH=127 /DNA_ID=CAMNT_0051958341 /DNA_START=149 /DNA_END=532 /DNA_ORIENTATION=+
MTEKTEAPADAKVTGESSEATPMDTSGETKAEETKSPDISGDGDADESKEREEQKKAESEAAASGSKAGSASKPSTNTMPIRAYLDHTVVPILLAGMSQLCKERPDCDEIEWLAHWMLRNNPNKKVT